MKHYQCVYIEFISAEERKLSKEYCYSSDKSNAYKALSNKLKSKGKVAIILHVQPVIDINNNINKIAVG